MKITLGARTEISVRKLTDLECRLDKQCGKKSFYRINETYLINDLGLPASFGEICFTEKVIGIVLFKTKFVFYRTSKFSIGKYEDVVRQFIK